MSDVLTQDFMKTMSSIQANALADALGPFLTGQREVADPSRYLPDGMKHYQNYKASGNPSSSAYLYANGGLFGRCDSSPTLINALVGPIGFEAVLDWVGTNTQNEFVEALTGVPASGSEGTTPCGDCPTVSMRACEQLYCFGRFCRQTEELQFDKIGVHANGNVPEKVLFGNIVDAAGNILVRQGESIPNVFFAQSRLAGYHLALKNSQLLWSGDPCNNDGSYEEFRGFQNIINTGKYDAKTQISCPATDSFLMNMNFASFTTDGANAVRRWFSRMVNQFEFRARGAGLDWNSAEMYIVMHPNLWDCVARVYACAGLDLCSVSGTQNEVVANADQALNRHEEYLTRRTLPINGRNYPVVLDSEIPDTTGQANGVCSDIYFITTRIGGQTITWGQYQDFNQTFGQTHQELVGMFGSDHINITDNGRYAMVFDNSRGCFDVQLITKTRVISTMPWLSGRIQNVCCDVLQQPFPDTSGSGGVYEVDGGRAVSPVPTLYGPCRDC